MSKHDKVEENRVAGDGVAAGVEVETVQAEAVQAEVVTAPVAEEAPALNPFQQKKAGVEERVTKAEALLEQGEIGQCRQKLGTARNLARNLSQHEPESATALLSRINTLDAQAIAKKRALQAGK